MSKYKKNGIVELFKYNRKAFDHEEFEFFLRTFYLSLFPLSKSKIVRDIRDYLEAVRILNRFAERHGVEKPEHSIITQDCNNIGAWQNQSLLSLIDSFWKDYRIGTEPRTNDGQDRIELKRLILRVFDRYGIAHIKYHLINNNERIPEFVNWNPPYNTKTLEEVIKEANVTKRVARIQSQLLTLI